MQYCGEFDNWGAVMSVSSELLCSFELLKPLDSSALKSHIKKSRNKRQNMLNSPVRPPPNSPSICAETNKVRHSPRTSSLRAYKPHPRDAAYGVEGVYDTHG